MRIRKNDLDDFWEMIDEMEKRMQSMEEEPNGQKRKCHFCKQYKYGQYVDKILFDPFAKPGKIWVCDDCLLQNYGKGWVNV